MFMELFKSFNCKMAQHSYLTEQYKLFKIGYQINPDSYMLGVTGNKFDIIISEDLSTQHFQDTNGENSYLASRKQKSFEAAESAASEVTYRCIDCRKCQKCRKGESIEIISIKEEIEQDVINKSVNVDINKSVNVDINKSVNVDINKSVNVDINKSVNVDINKSVNVDIKKGITTARLPFMHNPSLKLAPNKERALAVYKSQVKKLSNNKHVKDDVIKSEGKLQQMGYVDYVLNLPSDHQQQLRDNPIQNFLS